MRKGIQLGLECFHHLFDGVGQREDGRRLPFVIVIYFFTLFLSIHGYAYPNARVARRREDARRQASGRWALARSRPLCPREPPRLKR